MERRFTYGSKTGRFLLSLVFVLLMTPFVAFEQENTKVTLNFKNTAISKVFYAIEYQSGYTFFYTGSVIDGEMQVTINVKSVSIDNALNELLEPLNVTYQIKNKSIIIKKEKKSETLKYPLIVDTLPSISVTGRVVDGKDVPLPGVTVNVKGKTVNVVTDNNGFFKLPGVRSNVTIIFSSIGYESQEINIKKNSVVNIALREKVTELQKIEVVSTGYQEISKERVTGSFSQIDNELFNRRVGSNVLDRITDLTPGMLSFKRNLGDPSNDQSQLNDYFIRGVSTINAETRPLLVVDNYIYDGDPSLINPNDVDNITILKDAAASSIWGVRAGNGVIVITMKKGRFNRKMSLNFNSNITIESKPNYKKIPSIPSSEIISLEQERYTNGYYDGLLEYYAEPLPNSIIVLDNQKKGLISTAEAQKQLKALSAYDIRSEIMEHLLRSSITQRYSLSFSGGDNKYTYYTSLGYDKKAHNAINNKDERISLRLNNIWRPLQNLSITGEINWIRSIINYKNAIGNNFSSFLQSPYTHLVNANGTPASFPMLNQRYIDTVSFPGKLNWNYIPLHQAQNGQFNQSTNNVILIAGAEYQILDGLKISSQYQWMKTNSSLTDIQSIDLYETRDLINRYSTIDPNTGLLVYPIPLGGLFRQSNSDLTSWNIRGRIDYQKQFGFNDISGFIGIDNRETTSNNYLPQQEFGYLPETYQFQQRLVGTWIDKVTQEPNTFTANTGIYTGNISRFGSYLGAVSYTYNQKYTANLSGRIDQSNFFGVRSNDRKVPLWSLGAAWSVSNENFYNINWLPMLKFRSSYGYSGNINAGISPFATAAYRGPGYPTNLPFSQLVTPPNPTLKWEKVRQINIGLDYSLNNQIITGSIDVYQKKSINLIGPIVSPPSSGYLSYTSNKSSMISRGIDFTLTSKNKIGNILLLNTFNFSFNTNKVTNYDFPMPTGQTDPTYFSGSKIPLVGKPIDKLYVYKWEGLSNTGYSRTMVGGKIAEGDEIQKAKFEDYIYIGRTTPAYFGALRTNIIWNNVQISAGINYLLHYYFQRASFSGTLSSRSTFEHIDYVNRWKKPGDENITNIPVFSEDNNTVNYSTYKLSEYLVERGDHIKVQDVRIDYNFKKETSKWLPCRQVGIYAYVNNIGIIWKKSKYNPEYSENLLSLPLPRTYSIGINFNY